MAPSNPRIRIHKATPADAPTMAEIEFAAFGADTISQLMYPPPVSVDSKAKAMLNYFPPGGSAKPNAEALLMVAELLPPPAEDGSVDDSAPGEVVALGRWVLRREPMAESEWDVENVVTAEMMGEGANAEVYDWFIGEMHRRLRSIVRGEPHLYLKGLACFPHRQGLGAGSALVRWGNEIADSLGLASWLEASPYGYPVYKKLGFEDVHVLDFKIAETWGVTKEEGRNWGESSALELGGPLAAGSLRTVIMRRPARGP